MQTEVIMLLRTCGQGHTTPPRHTQHLIYARYYSFGPLRYRRTEAWMDKLTQLVCNNKCFKLRKDPLSPSPRRCWESLKWHSTNAGQSPRRRNDILCPRDKSSTCWARNPTWLLVARRGPSPLYKIKEMCDFKYGLTYWNTIKWTGAKISFFYRQVACSLGKTYCTTRILPWHSYRA